MMKYDPLDYLNLRKLREARALDEETQCMVTNPKKETIDQLNPNNVTALINEAKTNFSNHSVLEKLFCLFRTTLVMANGVVDDRIANTASVLRYIKSLTVKSKDSKFGIIYEVNVGRSDPLEDLILIKTLKDPAKGTLFHEFFVAAAFTNSLRQIIPNFAYTYAYFKCSNPQFGSNNLVPVSYCADTANPGEYLVMEKINGDTLTKWCEKPTSSADFLSYIIQLILSLRTASLMNGFTHFDLHTGNVMLRDISEPIAYVKYPYMDRGVEKYKYVRCSKVATIIDFGYSFINYKNHSYSMPDFDNEYHQQSRPLVDIYRIIMWSLYGLKSFSRQNTKAGDILVSLFKLARMFAWVDNMYNRVVKGPGAKWSEIDRIRAVLNSPDHRMDPKNDKQGPAFMLTKNQEIFEPRYYQDDPWMQFVADTIAVFPTETAGMVLDDSPPAPILTCDSGRCRSAESIVTQLHPVDVTVAGKRTLI